MSVAPIALSERRRGRPCTDDVEAATPTGRALQWLEARVFDAAVSIIRFRDAFEREALLDKDCDDRVTRAIKQLDAGNGIEARALLLEYQERDALRDAANAEGGICVTVLHAVVVKRIGAFIEKSCIALRSKG